MARKFDVVVIDEAAQAVEPAILVPLVQGVKQVSLDKPQQGNPPPPPPPAPHFPTRFQPSLPHPHSCGDPQYANTLHTHALLLLRSETSSTSSEAQDAC